MECAGKRSATALWLLRGDARAYAAPPGLDFVCGLATCYKPVASRAYGPQR